MNKKHNGEFQANKLLDRAVSFTFLAFSQHKCNCHDRSRAHRYEILEAQKGMQILERRLPQTCKRQMCNAKLSSTHKTE